MSEKRKLGELLVEAGLLDNLQLRSALAYQKKWGKRLGSALIEMRFISERDLAGFLEQQLGAKSVSIMDREIPEDVIRTLEPDIARKYGVFPLEVKDKVVTVATSNPLDLAALDDLGFRIGKTVRPKLALESEIDRAIRFYYDHDPTAAYTTDSSRSIPIEEQKITFEPVNVSMSTLRVPVEAVYQEALSGKPGVQDLNQDEKEAAASRVPEKDLNLKHVLNALISLLEDKGVVTRDELYREIRKKR